MPACRCTRRSAGAADDATADDPTKDPTSGARAPEQPAGRSEVRRRDGSMQTGRRDPNPRANGSAGVERAVAEDTGAGGGAVRCDGGGGGATITMTHSSLSLPPRPTTLPQKQLCRFFAFCLGATTMTMDDDDALSVLWTPPFFFFFSSLFPHSSSFPSFSLLFSSLISSLPLSSLASASVLANEPCIRGEPTLSPSI